MTRVKSVLTVSVKLSHRETEVVMCVCQGLSNREISSELSLARTTVGKYISMLFIGLGLRSRTQLAMWAVAHDGCLLPSIVPVAMHPVPCGCYNAVCRMMRESLAKATA